MSLIRERQKMITHKQTTPKSDGEFFRHLEHKVFNGEEDEDFEMLVSRRETYRPKNRKTIKSD